MSTNPDLREMTKAIRKVVQADRIKSRNRRYLSQKASVLISGAARNQIRWSRQPAGDDEILDHRQAAWRPVRKIGLAWTDSDNETDCQTLEGIAGWFDSQAEITSVKQPTRQARPNLSYPPKIPTLQVSLTHAAKNWFDISMPTLKKQINGGKVRAKQMSPKLWVFDLDDVTDMNPDNRADVDPSMKTG